QPEVPGELLRGLAADDPHQQLALARREAVEAEEELRDLARLRGLDRDYRKSTVRRVRLAQRRAEGVPAARLSARTGPRCAGSRIPEPLEAPEPAAHAEHRKRKAVTITRRIAAEIVEVGSHRGAAKGDFAVGAEHEEAGNGRP